MADAEPPDFLDLPVDAKDVERRAARGGVVTVVGNILRALISGAGTLLLVRILSPKDFGLVGMIISVTGFFDLLKDFGLSSATIQRDRIDHDQVNALFWINVGIGVVLTVGTAVLAPVLALGYGRSELITLTLALSASSLLGAIPLQHEALLKRDLRFAPLAWITVAASTAGTVCAVLAAMRGWGPWALVVRQLVRLATRAVLTWVVSPWKPTKPASANVRELVRFGTHVSGFQLMNYLERNFDNMLIGRFVGAQALGFYDKAYQVMRLPLDEINRPVAGVIVATLSRLAGTPERYRNAYAGVTRCLMLITVPLGPLFYLTAPWAVPTILGSKWVAMVPILQWLAIGLLIKPLLYTTSWLLISQGRTHELFRWGVFASTTAVASFAVGLPWGAVGVSMSYTLLELVVRAPVLLWWVGKSGPVRLRDLVATMFPAWTCAAVLAVTYVLVDSQLHSWSDTARVAVCGPVSVVSGVGAVLLLPWSKRIREDGKSLVRTLRARKS